MWSAWLLALLGASAGCPDDDDATDDADDAFGLTTSLEIVAGRTLASGLAVAVFPSRKR
jgi:hypothetical protein